MNKLMLYLRMIRVKQWAKNVLIFLPFLISPYEITIHNFQSLIITFALFCCSASLIYIVNDWVDRKSDALNVNKKHRPFASGDLHFKDALVGFLFLLVIFVFLNWKIYLVTPSVSILIIIYCIQSVLYSFYLKNISLVEMFIVSTGYSYRALAGGLSVYLLPSSWMLLTIFLASLFMVAQKRLSDKLSIENQDELRPVIKAYPDKFLNIITGISAASAIISYVLFTLSEYAQIKFQNPYLSISSVFVIYATFRYLLVAMNSLKAHDPIYLIVKDRHMKVCIFMYFVFIIITNSI